MDLFGGLYVVINSIIEHQFITQIVGNTRYVNCVIYNHSILLGSIANIQFVSCFIDRLVLDEGANNIDINDTKVCYLCVHSTTLNTLRMKSSYIAEIKIRKSVNHNKIPNEKTIHKLLLGTSTVGTINASRAGLRNFYIQGGILTDRLDVSSNSLKDFRIINTDVSLLKTLLIFNTGATLPLQDLRSLNYLNVGNIVGLDFRKIVNFIKMYASNTKCIVYQNIDLDHYQFLWVVRNTGYTQHDMDLLKYYKEGLWKYFKRKPKYITYRII